MHVSPKCPKSPLSSHGICAKGRQNSLKMGHIESNRTSCLFYSILFLFCSIAWRTRLLCRWHPGIALSFMLGGGLLHKPPAPPPPRPSAPSQLKSRAFSSFFSGIQFFSLATLVHIEDALYSLSIQRHFGSKYNVPPLVEFLFQLPGQATAPLKRCGIEIDSKVQSDKRHVTCTGPGQAGLEPCRIQLTTLMPPGVRLGGWKAVGWVRGWVDGSPGAGQGPKQAPPPPPLRRLGQAIAWLGKC